MSCGEARTTSSVVLDEAHVDLLAAVAARRLRRAAQDHPVGARERAVERARPQATVAHDVDLGRYEQHVRAEPEPGEQPDDERERRRRWRSRWRPSARRTSSPPPAARASPRPRARRPAAARAVARSTVSSRRRSGGRDVPERGASPARAVLARRPVGEPPMASLVSTVEPMSTEPSTSRRRRPRERACRPLRCSRRGTSQISVERAPEGDRHAQPGPQRAASPTASANSLPVSGWTSSRSWRRGPEYGRTPSPRRRRAATGCPGARTRARRRAQQQREQREEGVVGDQRRETRGAVVEELAHNRHGERDRACRRCQ